MFYRNAELCLAVFMLIKSYIYSQMTSKRSPCKKEKFVYEAHDLPSRVRTLW